MSDSCAPFPISLADPIIYEILTRLPAKSIHRFKCVSKKWLSLISTPHFISSFLSHSSPSWAIVDRAIRVDPDPTHTLNLTHSEPPRVSFFSITNLVPDPAESNGQDFPVVTNASDGLFLFTVERKRDPHKEYEKNSNSFSSRTKQYSLLICNPITRQWARIPDPPEMLNHRGAIGLATRVMGPNGPGLVVDFVVAEFQPIIGSQHASLLTFCSETGKWDVKNGNYNLGLHVWRPGGSFELNGVMYWVDLSFGLVAWDEPFSREKNIRCRFLSLPYGCRRPYYTRGLEENRCIEPNGGEIKYLELGQDGGFLDLWRFKDCKEKEGEWSLVYKVDLVNVWNGVNSVPYCMFFHPFEVDVAFFRVGGNVIGVNVREKKVVSSSTYSNLVGKMFLLPFVIPSWPTSLPPAIIAVSEKDRGNECFKEKKFLEAVNWYSRSIISSPTAVAYANRAAAYLEIARYQEAESDCTEALKLDEKYMKAYARRAIARKELGKLEEAKEDTEFALELEPKQAEVLKQFTEINFLLEKATIDGNGMEDGAVSQS